MIKKVVFFFFISIGFFGFAQKKSTEFRSKKFLIKKDTIQIDSVNLNSQKFKVLDKFKNEILSTEYQVDFLNALLIIDPKKYSEITVEYYVFPEFLTKTYQPFDEKLIVPEGTNTGKLYSLTTNKKPTDIKLFDGLDTKGFIVRGLTSGNNQNVVTNAGLDLEISGKLSKNVTLRANIFDTNIPLQQNGYSQNITDFDRIFIEMFSKNWRVKAGDVSLKNNNSYFLNFEKQVAGIAVEAAFNENLKASVSGAIVRGRFSSYNFVGLEGNQGPYKLFGPNNEPAIIVIAGSEKVFVNGIQVNRGEDKEYTIDYNLAEIRFTTTYPITNDMRIRVEFQFSDRNYTRFITYNKTEYESDKFSLSGHFYSENAAKNQPLQQSLSTSQKEILANAGNDISKMIAPSAFMDEFSENKILYKKVIIGNIETFEYSKDSSTDLHSVIFTNVGFNQGSYILESTVATGNIFKYVGVSLGNYQPIVRLVAPSKLQVAVVNSIYRPTEKTSINSEIAFSNKDSNLFSTINNDENKGIAAKLNWKQILIDNKWQLKSDVNYQFIHQNFNTVQRFQNVEFFRDWNLINPTGNQSQIATTLSLENKKKDYVLYRFNSLSFSDNFNGSKHEVASKFVLKNTSFFTDVSLLNNTSSLEDNSFFRAKSTINHHFNKSWVGGFVNLETNDRKKSDTKEFVNTSHRFKEYESYFGVGDSAKVFAKFGYNFRNNDSIKSNRFTEINNRKTFYLNSQILKNKTSNLSIYANYRMTKNTFSEDEKSLNSKVVYNQQLWNTFLVFGTVYETSSGNVPQQDFVYIKTEPGQGFYTWRDYNNDGVQDFNEFEIAQFQDQATYLRVALPNLRFVATQRAKWNQSFAINPSQWINKSGVKKVLSHFYNQSYLSIENEQERVGDSFNLNPFDFDENKLVTLNFNFRNSIYFNRNLQKYSFIYTYGESKNKQQYFIGNQENTTDVQQIEFSHKITKFWLLDILGKQSNNNLETQNFANRNYQIRANEFQPKISFLYNKDHRFSAFYHFKNKENLIGDFEVMKQQKIGVEYFFISKKKNQISADFNAFFNEFSGNSNSPIAYQMLEGLQAGKNFTWSLLFNQKLNTFLNLNLSYLGRKSEESKTIHTGTVQLRAVF
ncbi:hypothetical protein OD91_1241 [Lutibacter sp. Hel_I_33_5]|uniref:hypothetical protein n=1 Tax=Lutibacter sp. Hel_I_33_5 TaxID=1566289 RepID=UPI0011A23391|nr:hypothetical protein [Lutibacter sp. Hel_I_33_5]TVZ55967.1 hypothetical protein OD91_1241 [Lutibacter sp. Hel_I_33_5]